MTTWKLWTWTDGAANATLDNGTEVELTTEVPDTLEWARSFEQQDRRVALTTIGDLTVSTVFLGIDHAFSGGPPLLFETMIYRGDCAEWLDEQWRYSTWDQAAAGHEAACALVTSGEIK